MRTPGDLRRHDQQSRKLYCKDCSEKAATISERRERTRKVRNRLTNSSCELVLQEERVLGIRQKNVASLETPKVLRIVKGFVDVVGNENLQHIKDAYLSGTYLESRKLDFKGQL